MLKNQLKQFNVKSLDSFKLTSLRRLNEIHCSTKSIDQLNSFCNEIRCSTNPVVQLNPSLNLIRRAGQDPTLEFFIQWLVPVLYAKYGLSLVKVNKTNLKGFVGISSQLNSSGFDRLVELTALRDLTYNLNDLIGVRR